MPGSRVGSGLVGSRGGRSGDQGSRGGRSGDQGSRGGRSGDSGSRGGRSGDSGSRGGRSGDSGSRGGRSGDSGSRGGRSRHIVWAVLLATSAFVAGWPVAGEAATGTPGTLTESGNQATIPVGNLPTSVAVDEIRGAVWVVNSRDNTLSEISASRRVVIATLRVGANPVDVAVDQKTATVWVTCLGPFDRPSADNTVDEVSETSGRLIASFKVGAAPFGITADPRTGTVWVADSDSSAVSEISEARQAVVAVIHTGPGTQPAGVAVDPDTGVVWVANLGGLIEKISEASRSVTGSIKVRPNSAAESLNAIAAYQGTGTAWAASDSYVGGSYVSRASVVPQAAREVTGGVVVSKPTWFSNVADGIAVDPATSTVWVTESGANTLTMISAGVRAVARNLSTGAGPGAVAVDSRNGTAWVTDNTAGTVTEYSYSSPKFTTKSTVELVPGKRVSLQVHTKGFPIAIMTVEGALPPGMRARIGEGTVGISGRPAVSARGRVFRVSVSADNGVGTADGQYVFTQQLVIQVGKVHITRTGVQRQR